MAILEDIKNATMYGKWKEISELINTALEQRIDVLEIIDNALTPAMTEVGDKFSVGEMFMPDMLLAAKTMKTAMEILKPKLVGRTITEKGTVVMGTIEGDLHDIGKNMVLSMLEGVGYKTIDLGIDQKPERFIEAIKQYKPDVVGFSGLLTTTLAGIPKFVKALEDVGLRDSVILAVGGAPVTQDFADRNKIDLYAPDASMAVKVINKALTERKK
ncbi:MAG: corrinoid protein [Actinobacteria bacterium]|nr:corrinoid protein [Actinomycetota bacterium]